MSLSLIQLNGHMVRIAQSLGLHRHARRFRMGVGEIELRKRLWWWIYTFDRITALVHGLPPLINDNDVDQDMPTDCRLQDLDATELVHPLPGQTTPVHFFNHYATMGKKLSSILDLLYTTTRRGDGSSKIERLDREMRVWSQNLEAGDDCNSLESSHLSLPPADKGCSLMLLWLRLLVQYSIILIHRPGLTFDDTTPEFGTCLGACVRASTEILHLLSLSALTLYFRSLCPVGPALVFQCGLMHIYCQCKIAALNFTGIGMPGLGESIAAVSQAVEILERYTHQVSLTPATQGLRGDFYVESINATIKALKTLSVLFQHTPEAWQTEPLPDLSYPSFGVSSLYDLNHMTAMDWAQDISDTFGHLPDLGG
ncbi:fungal-specific transcription factor domain-containing protein [Aspergillus karnatakaensis]|uniref:fungal specific transcription factor domain-containing protein n=1 Tax=Aspergillus karnatakaensis TaxID=1810916 RepID=UPI003CCDD48E